MINFNGTILSSTLEKLENNRAFQYGDGIFETVKILNGKVLFLEDHYFRLMSGMRIIRMEIPMNFTMEYFEEQILAVTEANSCLLSGRAKMTVFRNTGGFYLPKDNTISFLVTSDLLENQIYNFEKANYEIDLFKDFYVTRQLLSTIKSTNRLINITGSIYAAENGLDNCLLLNDSKNVVEALQGNLFVLTGNRLVTPPLSEGCLNGVMRKQILAIAGKIENLEVVEEIISPFDLQKSDEMFITNVIKGIQPITRYRKKDYTIAFAENLLTKLNAMIRFAN